MTAPISHSAAEGPIAPPSVPKKSKKIVCRALIKKKPRVFVEVAEKHHFFYQNMRVDVVVRHKPVQHFTVITLLKDHSLPPEDRPDIKQSKKVNLAPLPFHSEAEQKEKWQLALGAVSIAHLSILNSYNHFQNPFCEFQDRLLRLHKMGFEKVKQKRRDRKQPVTLDLSFFHKKMIDHPNGTFAYHIINMEKDNMTKVLKVLIELSVPGLERLKEMKQKYKKSDQPTIDVKLFEHLIIDFYKKADRWAKFWSNHFEKMVEPLILNRYLIPFLYETDLKALEEEWTKRKFKINLVGFIYEKIRVYTYQKLEKPNSTLFDKFDNSFEPHFKEFLALKQAFADFILIFRENEEVLYALNKKSPSSESHTQTLLTPPPCETDKNENSHNTAFTAIAARAPAAGAAEDPVNPLETVSEIILRSLADLLLTTTHLPAKDAVRNAQSHAKHLFAIMDNFTRLTRNPVNQQAEIFNAVCDLAEKTLLIEQVLRSIDLTLHHQSKDPHDFYVHHFQPIVRRCYTELAEVMTSYEIGFVLQINSGEIACRKIGDALHGSSEIEKLLTIGYHWMIGKVHVSVLTQQVSYYLRNLMLITHRLCFVHNPKLWNQQVHSQLTQAMYQYGSQFNATARSSGNNVSMLTAAAPAKPLTEPTSPSEYALTKQLIAFEEQIKAMPHGEDAYVNIRFLFLRLRVKLTHFSVGNASYLYADVLRLVQNLMKEVLSISLRQDPLFFDEDMGQDLMAYIKQLNRKDLEWTPAEIAFLGTGKERMNATRYVHESDATQTETSKHMRRNIKAGTHASKTAQAVSEMDLKALGEGFQYAKTDPIHELIDLQKKAEAAVQMMMQILNKVLKSTPPEQETD